MTKLRRRMNTQSSLPSLKAVGGLCLEVSLRTWCLTHFCINAFAMQNTRPFSIRKIHAEMGQAPTSQARPQDTDDLRPSHLAAGTLSLVEHTLSTFRGDAFPMRRRLVAAVICYVRKARSFFRRQRSQMTRHYREFWYGEGKTCFVFCCVECNVRKSRSFLHRQRAETTPSLPTALLAGLSTTERKSVLLLCFQER